MGSDSMIAFMFGTMLIFMIILSIVCIVLYVLDSIGLYTMAENLNIENSWFAFIPVLNTYIMGKISGEVKILGIEIKRPEIVLPVSYILMVIPVIGTLIAIAAIVLYLVVLYNIFKKYSPEKANVMIICSILIGFVKPIFIFNLRNKVPVSVSVSVSDLDVE